METDKEVSVTAVERTSQDPDTVREAAVNDYSRFSLTELHRLLEEAVASENYEKAASLRDEISKKEL